MTDAMVPANTDKSPAIEPYCCPECEEVDVIVASDEGTDVANGFRLFPNFEELTPLEAEWAEQNLNLPTVVTIHESRSANNWNDTDEGWFRSAGYIIASPGTFDRFKIVLYRGATRADLEWLETAVRLAKRGFFLRHGWNEVVGYDRQYAFDWSRSVDLKDYPGMTRVSVPLVECTEPACRESIHDGGETILHEADKIKGDGYEVSLEAVESAGRHDPWMVCVDVGDGEFTPASAAGLASDLQYLAAECRKLNEQREAAE
jgi:hypothetical protein